MAAATAAGTHQWLATSSLWAEAVCQTLVHSSDYQYSRTLHLSFLASSKCELDPETHWIMIPDLMLSAIISFVHKVR